MIMSIDKEDANNDCDDMRKLIIIIIIIIIIIYFFLLLPLTKMLSQKPWWKP